MSISASSGNNDLIVRGGPGESLFEDGRAAVVVGSTAATWNQGDLMCFDTGALTLRPVSATGDGVTFVGVADNAVTNGQLNSPYQGLTPVDASQKGPGFVGPKYGVTARLLLHVGDSFTIGAKVYLSNGDNTQTVTVTDPGDHNYVGIFVGLVPVTSAVAGQTGDILIGARYPFGTGAQVIF
jgi:hypothetical protein